MLAKLTKSTVTWDKSLNQVEYALNNSVNRSTGKSPSEFLFGTEQLSTDTSDQLRELLKELMLEEERDLKKKP